MKGKKIAIILLYVAALGILGQNAHAQSTVGPEWRNHRTLVDVPSLTQFRAQSPTLAIDSPNGDHLIAWSDNRELFQGTASGTKVYAQFYNRNGQPSSQPIILPQEGVSQLYAVGPDVQGNFYSFYISEQRKITIAKLQRNAPHVITTRQITTNGLTILYSRPNAVLENDRIYLTATKIQAGNPSILVFMVLGLDGTVIRPEQPIAIPNQGTNNVNDAILAKGSGNNLLAFYKLQSTAYVLEFDRTSGTVQWNMQVDSPIDLLGDLVVDEAQNKVFLAWSVPERINSRDTTNIFFSHHNLQTGQPTAPRVRITSSEWYQSRPKFILSDEGLDMFYKGTQPNGGVAIFDVHLNYDGSIDYVRLTEPEISVFEHALAKHLDRIFVYFSQGNLGHQALDRTYYRPALEGANPRIASITEVSLFDARRKNANAYVALSFSTNTGIPLPNGLIFPLDPDILFFLSYLFFPNGQIVRLDQNGRATANLWLPATIPINIPFSIAFGTFTDRVHTVSSQLQLVTQP